MLNMKNLIHIKKIPSSNYAYNTKSKLQKLSLKKQNVISDWPCKNRACGHTKFDYFFEVSSPVTFYCIITQS